MPAEKISLAEAKSEKLFYVVSTVVIYRPDDGRCLILKRDEREKVHPGRWGVPGGKLEWADLNFAHPTKEHDDVKEFGSVLTNLAHREAKEEAGVNIDDVRFSKDLAFVRPDGVPVVLMRFAARYAGGEVAPEKGGFTDSAWVNNAETKNYELIEGIENEIAEAIRLFSK